MLMTQGLYAQVVNIRRKYLELIAENRNKMKLNSSSKVNLQDHSVGSILTLIGLKYILAHLRLISIKKLFQSYDDTKDTNTFKIFQVLIGNSKCVEIVKFQNDSPMLKCCQKLLSSCCFSSLASAFASI